MPNASQITDYLRSASKETIAHQIKFTEIPCLDPYSRERARFLIAAWRAAGLAPKCDAVGNVLAVRKGHAPQTRPTVIVCAHLDSVFKGLIRYSRV